MSQRGPEALLRPKSIAVIGASMKPQRAGYLMMRNLLAGGFNGPVLPVTPAWKAVQGVLARPDVDSLPFTPDLAVLCTNARRNLELLEALGQKGAKPASFSLPYPNSIPLCWNVPLAIRCGCSARTVLACLRRGRVLTPAFRRCLYIAVNWRLFRNRRRSPILSSTGLSSVRWVFLLYCAGR